MRPSDYPFKEMIGRQTERQMEAESKTHCDINSDDERGLESKRDTRRAKLVYTRCILLFGPGCLLENSASVGRYHS